MEDFWEYMGLKGARVAIIHHDDLGMFKAQNDAYRSLPFPTGSILAPAAWVPDLLVNPKPGADLGVHLTLNSEWSHCRIRPLTCGASLRDEQGYLFRTVEEAWRSVRAEEAEAELRAQIEHVIRLGIDVTHIDTHMGSVLRPDIAEVYVKLACEYRVPALIPESVENPMIPPPFRGQLARLLSRVKLPRVKLAGIPYAKLEHEQRLRAFRDFLLNAEPGVYHVIHHSCFRNEETRDLPDIDIREGDFRILTDPEIRMLLEEKWELITYREIRDAFRRYMGSEPWLA
ncbi:MAG: ChbG/HpnK family deacetylase [Thermofilaceae archaeon]